MTTQDELTSLSLDQLEHITGGAHARHQQQPQHASPFGFLDGPYKSVVFHFASQIGGNKLADRMYGSHTSAADRARAQAAMQKFLVAGNKLPAGVPNLFG